METTYDTTGANSKETEVGSANKDLTPAVAPANADNNAETMDAYVEEEKETRKRKTKKARRRRLPRRRSW
jgi:hypothetical protein